MSQKKEKEEEAEKEEEEEERKEEGEGREEGKKERVLSCPKFNYMLKDGKQIRGGVQAGRTQETTAQSQTC